jgi:Thioesterase domain
MRSVRNPVARAFSSSPAIAGLFAGAVAFLSLILLPAGAQSAANPAPRQAALSHPHVYLMRGLLNIFSLGMDQLAVQIERHGIAASVYNHTYEDSVVEEIAQKYRVGDHGPFILVGHSLGADAVMVMAQQLNAKGVPVALVVPFDGTASYAATPNVACVLNITQRLYAHMTPGAGFRGKLSNMNVSSDTSIDHFTIDKSPRLQAVALNSVLQAAHQESCRPGIGAPTVARPKTAPAPKIAAPKTPVPKLAAPAKDTIPALRPRYEGKVATPDRAAADPVEPAKTIDVTSLSL